MSPRPPLKPSLEPTRFRRLCRFGWAATAALVITVAILISIARMLVPLLENYRGDLQQMLSTYLDRPVSIGELSAGWSGLHPRLRLMDVTVHDQDGTRVWLHLDEVQASVDLIGSLINKRLETGDIRLVGAQIDVERLADGRYFVSGVQAGSGGRDLLAWLARRQQVSIVDSRLSWKDERLSTQPLEFSDVELHLGEAGSDYRVSGSARLGEHAEPLLFVLSVGGDSRRPDSLHSRFYLEGGLAVGPWLNGKILADTSEHRGQLNFRVWGEGTDAIDSLTADVDMRDAGWRTTFSRSESAQVERLFSLDELRGQVFWRRAEDGWSLDLHRLEMGRDGRRWPTVNGQVRVSSRETVSGHLSFVRLQDINALLLAVPHLPEEMRMALAGLNLRGDLFQPAVRFRGGFQTQPERFEVKASLQDFGMDQWRSLPAVAGIDGDLQMNHSGGIFEARSRGLVLDMPDQFRTPLQVTELVGALSWQKSGDGWRLDGSDLRLKNPDIAARGQFAFLLPGSPASPFLDLQLDFENGNVGRAADYLPRGIMPPNVVGWLDHSLVSGHVTHGKLSYFGYTKDFPFQNRRGSFDVSFGVEDLILDYANDWPRAEEVAAEVNFRDRSFRALFESGKILGVDVEPGEVAIDELGREAVIRLNGRARGSLGDLLRYVSESPLGREQSFFRQVDLAGTGLLDLDFQLPLRRLPDSTVRAKVSFSEAGVAWPDFASTLTGMDGDLVIDWASSGLSLRSPEVAARFDGRPATIKVTTRGAGERRLTEVELRTKADLSEWLDRYSEDGALVRQTLSGSSDWRVRLALPDPGSSRAAPATLRLESSLRGTRISLPGSLAKPPQAQRNLSIEIPLSGDMNVLKIDYGDDVRGVFRLEQGPYGKRLERGELRLGGQPARMPSGSGLFVAGRFAGFSATEWRQWSESRVQENTRNDLIGALRGLDLQVGELELFDYRFRDVKLHARKRLHHWEGEVDGPQVAGKIQVPLDLSTTNRILLNLARLHLVLGTEDHERHAPDPRMVPGLFVSSDELTFNGIGLGSLRLAADRVKDGVQVEQVELASDLFTLRASGAWLQEDQQSISRFSLEASTGDLGDALTRLGYAGGLRGGQARGTLEANWSGPPSAFELKRLNGKLNMKIKKGQFLRVDPGGGRVFGLLSIQALPRRLALDFSDLFGRGFSFDRIQGQFVIADGDAYTNDLHMEGPAARIDLSGRIGLAAQDYDQSALVTPSLASSIPLVGGIAAGSPGVGVGLWLADKLFGKKIDEMTRTRYTITGPWSNPEIEKAEPERQGSGSETGRTRPADGR